jgi:hypothetical protein
VIDWKLVGYTVSSFSVILLGAAAWPHADQHPWRMPALIGGMLLSVAGMACRYLSHRREKAAIAYAQREAEQSAGAPVSNEKQRQDDAEWSDDDDKFLSLSWSTGLGVQEISEELERTPASVNSRASNLGLSRLKNLSRS